MRTALFIISTLLIASLNFCHCVGMGDTLNGTGNNSSLAVVGSVNAGLFTYYTFLTLEAELGVRFKKSPEFVRRLSLSVGYTLLRVRDDYPGFIPLILRTLLFTDNNLEIGGGLLYADYPLTDPGPGERYWIPHTLYPTVMAGFCHQPSDSHFLFRTSLWLYTDSAIKTPLLSLAVTFGYTF
jgi:hypothetical protein